MRLVFLLLKFFCQISEVIGLNILSDGMVQKRVRAFKDCRQNVHDEERSGWLTAITEDLVQKLTMK